MLKTIEDNYLDKKVEVADSGGFYHHVYSVGMGSFWPYWEPRPVVIVKGTLGAEWMDWTNISYVEVEDE